MNQLLRRPALFNEPRREEIQQLRMRRFLAEPPKVIDRGDESASEQVMPDAIDQHARRERIRRARDVVRQFEPAAELRLVAARGNELEVAAWFRGKWFQMISA